MPYTIVGIVNLALGRIGVKRLGDPQVFPFTEDSTQANAANAIWEYIRDEVLIEKDWRFAKKRASIGKVAEVPLSGYDFAYPIPDDFLKLALGTDDDPSIYPTGYPYKFETMNIVAGIGGIAEFNPTSAYTSAAASKVKIGRYCELNVGSDKKLYIAATYKEDDVTFIDVECESNSIDTLAVTASGHTITIKLANATGAQNTAALIQAAIRALSTVDSISVANWTVTQNAAYLASYPTTGIDISAVPMGNGDKAYKCILNVTGDAANTSLFPPIEITYWEEVEPSATLCLATDYDNKVAGEELVIAYIRRMTDVTLFTPSFINALAFRIAAELAIHLTEGMTKFKGMMELYFLALNRADEINQSLDYFETIDDWKAGSKDSWVKAGR